LSDLQKGVKKMPFVQIFLIEGRPDDQKKKIIEKVTDALAEAAAAPREAIRVIIQEIPNTQWGIAGKTAKELRGGDGASQ
jgi:4-oxalocrotonate tautomerase